MLYDDSSLSRIAGSSGRGARNDANEGGNPDIVVVIAQQLRDLLPTIVIQVGNHLNKRGNRNDEMNNNNNNGRNTEGGNDHENPQNGDNNRNGNGCTYKEFKACAAIEFDGKGAALAYTRWVKKMESMIDISLYIHARGREVAVGMPWDDFKALLLEEYIHGLVLEIRGMVRATELSIIQSAILRAGALTDDAFRDEKLSKSGDKRK
ncbi:hypothetical protein Tco_0109168 [Tanacetum coccineum]